MIIEFVENIDKNGKNISKFIEEMLIFLKDVLIFKSTKRKTKIEEKNIKIEEIKDGNFSKSMVKEFIQNENLKVKTVYDSMNSTLAREVSLYLYDRDSSFNLLKEDLNKVDKESIKKVANKVKHINTVIIKSKGGKK